MASAHVAIALGDGSADGQVSVLTVHVVGSGSEIYRLLMNYRDYLSNLGGGKTPN